MNSFELRKKVTELKRKKKRNESKVPMEELLGKYKVPYTALCEELKTCQAELKAKYMEAVRGIAEILSEAVYADPDEEYGAMALKFRELDSKTGGDELLRYVMAGIAAFEDMGGSEKNGKTKI